MIDQPSAADVAREALRAYAEGSKRVGAPVRIGYDQPAFIHHMVSLRARGRHGLLDGCDHYAVGTQALAYWLAAAPRTVHCSYCATEVLHEFPVAGASCVECRFSREDVVRVLGLAGCVIAMVDLCSVCLNPPEATR
jgi:hypothetical protein